MCRPTRPLPDILGSPITLSAAWGATTKADGRTAPKTSNASSATSVIASNDQTENRLYVTIGNLDRQIPGELTKRYCRHRPAPGQREVPQPERLSGTTASLESRTSLPYAMTTTQFDVGAVWRYRDLNINELYDTATGARGSVQTGRQRQSDAELCQPLGAIRQQEHHYCRGRRHLRVLRTAPIFKHQRSTRRHDRVVQYSGGRRAVFSSRFSNMSAKTCHSLPGSKRFYAGRQFHNKFGTTDLMMMTIQRP